MFFYVGKEIHKNQIEADKTDSLSLLLYTNFVQKEVEEINSSKEKQKKTEKKWKEIKESKKNQKSILKGVSQALTTKKRDPEIKKIKVKDSSKVGTKTIKRATSIQSNTLPNSPSKNLAGLPSKDYKHTVLKNDKKKIQEQKTENFIYKKAQLLLSESKEKIITSKETVNLRVQNQNKYKQLLYSRIQSQLVYPGSAKRRKMEGIVVVQFTLDARGKLLGLKIINPSPYRILDKSALKTIQLASPFPPFLETMKERKKVFLIPIEYKKLY